MKRILSIFCLLASTIAMMAQSPAEIKAFKNMNKPLFKQIEKDYKGYIAEVRKTTLGTFFITISKKPVKGVTGKSYIMSEGGTLMYPEPVDLWKSFSNARNALALQNDKKWGVVDFDGNLIIPLSYDNVTYVSQNIESTVEKNGLWHPANRDGFITELAGKTNFHDNGGALYKTVNGCNKRVIDSFFLALTTNGKKGLYTLDGTQLIPPVFDDYEVLSKKGVVKTIVTDEKTGLRSVGAKSFRSGTSVEVPAQFYDVEWDESTKCFFISLHRDEPGIVYNPDSTYVVDYKDDGIKYWDAEKYDKVIEFYEGEGFGQPWGNYYMGLAAKAIAESERDILVNTINVLNNKDQYYYPIAYPDQYKINAEKALTMYLSSASYFEKYIKEDQVAEDDPTKLQARKLRGTMVSDERKYRDLLDEYTRQYAEASSKYAQVKAQLQIQQAQRAAQNAAVSRAIGNSVGSVLGKLFK